MAEYIEREALRKMFIEHFDAIYATDGRLIFSDHVCVGEDCEDILKLVDDMPTADVVEVRHGEWREVDQTGRNSRHIQYTTKQCSVCGYWNGRRKTNYCPNCGAKMDGKDGVEKWQNF